MTRNKNQILYKTGDLKWFLLLQVIDQINYMVMI
jgi:hypothetical protein